MPRKFIQSWIDEVEKLFLKQQLKLNPKADLTVVFLDKTQAKKINKQYRNKNYATDILSFDGDGQRNLGELVLCPEVVAKQARQHKLSFQQELGYMLLHGVLHLLDYDHENSEREAKKMFSIQDAAFDQLCRKFWNWDLSALVTWCILVGLEL